MCLLPFTVHCSLSAHQKFVLQNYNMFVYEYGQITHCLSSIVLRGKTAYFEMKFGLFCCFLRMAYKINFVNIFSGWFTQWGSSCEIILPTGFMQFSVSLHVCIFNKLSH